MGRYTEGRYQGKIRNGQMEEWTEGKKKGKIRKGKNSSE